jgi:protein SCO1/2
MRRSAANIAKVGLALLLLALVPGSPWAGRFRGGVVDPPRPAPELGLTAPDGTEFRLSQHRGEVVVVSFGYTFCPDVCPTTLAQLAKVRARLGPRSNRLRVVFVTIDPDRDRPARLRSFTQTFDRSFVGLTGSPARLARVRKDYGVIAEKRVVTGTSAAYLMDHSVLMYVIDPGGRLRLEFHPAMSIDDMVHDIEILLEK